LLLLALFGLPWIGAVEIIRGETDGGKSSSGARKSKQQLIIKSISNKKKRSNPQKHPKGHY